MSEIRHIYLFGNDSFEYGEALRDLVCSNNDPLVISFFEKTSYALRAEIGVLPRHQREEFERFANFAELVAHDIAGSLHPAFGQALSCAYQLASFIR